MPCISCTSPLSPCVSFFFNCKCTTHHTITTHISTSVLLNAKTKNSIMPNKMVQHSRSHRSRPLSPCHLYGLPAAPPLCCPVRASIPCNLCEPATPWMTRPIKQSHPNRACGVWGIKLLSSINLFANMKSRPMQRKAPPIVLRF